MVKTQSCFRNTRWPVSFNEACGATWRCRRHERRKLHTLIQQMSWKAHSAPSESYVSDLLSRPQQSSSEGKRFTALESFPRNCFDDPVFEIILFFTLLFTKAITIEKLCFRWTSFGSTSVSQGSLVVTQGFCTYISSSLVISLPAALYGLSHHGLAVVLPAPLAWSSDAMLHFRLPYSRTASPGFTGALCLSVFKVLFNILADCVGLDVAMMSNCGSLSALLKKHPQFFFSQSPNKHKHIILWGFIAKVWPSVVTETCVFPVHWLLC